MDSFTSVCQTQYITQFIDLANPGVVPISPQKASTRLQLAIIRDFDENRHVFNQYNKTDKAIKQPLISAVDDMFIKALGGYPNISTKQLLNNVYKRYGQLSPQDLKDNNGNVQ